MFDAMDLDALEALGYAIKGKYSGSLVKLAAFPTDIRYDIIPRDSSWEEGQEWLPWLSLDKFQKVEAVEISATSQIRRKLKPHFKQCLNLGYPVHQWDDAYCNEVTRLFETLPNEDLEILPYANLDRWAMENARIVGGSNIKDINSLRFGIRAKVPDLVRWNKAVDRFWTGRVGSDDEQPVPLGVLEPPPTSRVLPLLLTGFLGAAILAPKNVRKALAEPKAKRIGKESAK